MAEPQVRDFQTRSRAATAQVQGTNTRLFVDSSGDVEAQRHRRHSSVSPPSRSRQDNGGASTSGLSGITGRTSIESLRRRPTRHNTVRQYSVSPTRPQALWEEPGAEPGIDTQKEDAVLRFQHLIAECQITIVDFSEDRIEQHELDNRAFLEFLAKPRPDWVACRWVNVNGISFDVIRALQKEKNLHRLAIEDLMQPRSRTKADWYSDHAFSKFFLLADPSTDLNEIQRTLLILLVLLTLQKLVRLSPEDKSDLDPKGKWKNLRRRTWDSSADENRGNGSMEKPVVGGFVSTHNLHDVARADQGFRSLQQYRGGRNVERTMYMERHSALTEKGFAVSVEQVAIFLTSDNTCICFFENSADDIEGPILKRLDSLDTILRRSCDASMMVQAVIDAVIDLAIPVIAAYEDVMSDLELDVLTDPDIEHSKSLYILTSELSLLRNSIHPIGSLISALRDHRTDHPTSISMQSTFL